MMVNRAMRKLLLAIFLYCGMGPLWDSVSAGGPDTQLICPSSVEIGKPLSMLSYFTTDVKEMRINMTWTYLDSFERKIYVADCTEACFVRRSLSNFTFESNMTVMYFDEGNITTFLWQAQITIYPATTKALPGAWVAMWTIFDLVYEYYCEVKVEANFQDPPSVALYSKDYSASERSATFVFVLSQSTVNFSDLFSNVVKYFLLELSVDGKPVKHVDYNYKESSYDSDDNMGAAYLEYSVLGLEPSTVYGVSLTVVGYASNTSVAFDFTTHAAVLYCENNVDDAGILWTRTAAGTKSTQNCPSGYSGIAKRFCLQDGAWDDSNYLDCRNDQLTTVEEELTSITSTGKQVTQEQVTHLSQSLNNSLAESDDMLSGDIVQVVNILDKVGSVLDDTDESRLVDTTALENFANAADLILSTDDSKWDLPSDGTTGIEYGSKLVLAVDKIATSSLKDPGFSSEPIVKKNVAIKRDKASLDDIIFPNASDDNYDKYDGWVTNSRNKLSLSATNFDEDEKANDTYYAIVLFNGVDSKFAVNSQTQKRYSAGWEFRDLEVSSDIMSFSLSKDMEEFASPLNLEFEIRKVDNTDPLCGYLDVSLGPEPVWSSKGCTTLSSEGGVVTCQCNHLTNFAILMTPHKTDQEDDHHDILTIVTYVGCGISIVCLVITIVLYAITWKYVKENRSVLHVNLCVVLILAYAVFLAGVDRTENETVCTVVAALLHFLFLAAFFIMLVEGLQIFMSVTFVFTKELHLTLLLFMTYSLPIGIVGLTYGLMDTYDYRDSDFCWLNVDSYALWAFAGPALFVILVNFIVMCVTLRAMLTTVTMRTKDAKAKAKSSLRAVCLLSPIFGVTWVFGVFAINDSLVVFQYLFAVFNTLQGFFVFLFHCLLSNQIKDGLRHLLRKRRSRSFGTEERMYNNKTNSAKSNDSSRSASDSTPVSPTTERTDAGFAFPRK